MGDRKSIPFPIGKFELIVVVQGINHPGNLGAIARTMMNYGFKDLRLVNPKCSIEHFLDNNPPLIWTCFDI